MKNIARTAPRTGTASVGIMSVSEEVVALRADLERVQKKGNHKVGNGRTESKNSGM